MQATSLPRPCEYVSSTCGGVGGARIRMRERPSAVCAWWLLQETMAVDGHAPEVQATLPAYMGARGLHEARQVRTSCLCM